MTETPLTKRHVNILDASMAYQQQLLKAGAQLTAQLPSAGETAAKPDAQRADERRSG